MDIKNFDFFILKSRRSSVLSRPAFAFRAPLSRPVRPGLILAPSSRRSSSRPGRRAQRRRVPGRLRHANRLRLRRRHLARGPKDGGVAQRLSTARGEESFPRFSPDGTAIAFSGNYDGNPDIYVVPTGGRSARRGSPHHGCRDRMLDWYPDGKALLFASPHDERQGPLQPALHASAGTGGLPAKLPVPYGEFGAPLARTARAGLHAASARTSGPGSATAAAGARHLAVRPRDNDRENITANAANDCMPMWHGETLYFLSDREPTSAPTSGRTTCRRERPGRSRASPTTTSRFPSIGPSDMVFEDGGGSTCSTLPTKSPRGQGPGRDRPRHPQAARGERRQARSATPRLADGKRAALRGARRGLLGPGRERRRLQPDPQPGHGRALPGRGRRTARPSPTSPTGPASTSSSCGRPTEPARSRGDLARPGLPLPAHLVAGQQEARVRRPGDARSTSATSRPARSTTVDKGGSLFEGALEGFRPSWSADSRWLAYRAGPREPQFAIFLYDTQERQDPRRSRRTSTPTPARPSIRTANTSIS